jgi:hypothetical protein
MRLITKFSQNRGQKTPAHTFFEAKNIEKYTSNYVQLDCLNRVLSLLSKKRPTQTRVQ